MSLSPIAHAVSSKHTNFAPGDLAKSILGWTATADAGYAFANLDRAGGGIRVTCDGDDNDGIVVSYGGESVVPNVVGTRFGLTAVIKVTESAATANWFVGFSDESNGADFFADGATLKSMDAIGFHKVESSAFFRTVVVNATANSGETTTTAYADETEYRLRIEGECHTTGITVRFFINDILVDTVTDKAITDQDGMHPVVAIATGGTAEETIDVYQFVPYCIPA